MPAVTDRIPVTHALAGFQTHPLKKAASGLLAALGYRSDRVSPVPDSSSRSFLNLFAQAGSAGVFDQEKALVSEWKTADLLFQLPTRNSAANPASSPIPRSKPAC